jgi:superfamily II DNA/RNA helicase
MPNPHGRRRAPAYNRGNQRRGAGAGTAPRTPRPEPRSELDLALAAAARLPQPPATTFGELGVDPRLVRALAAQDITMPFAIQARALPDALAGRDVLGRAETGSGKTLAFGLPMLSRVAAIGSRPRETAPRGLVLVPTRELAEQVAEVLKPLGRSLGLLVTTVYGGVSIGRQIDRLRRGADIVVATPGRLIDLLDRRACTLSDVDVTVLDEADHMADLGFLPSVTRIMDGTPAGGQRLLFSATLDRGVDRLVQAYLTDPALHAVEPQAVAGGAAEHSMLVLDAADKVAVAAEMAGRPARTLFFVRTKHGADRLAKQLERAGVQAAAIHGDRNQNQRQRALDAFAAGYPRVLVATDVAARGIHVDGIELVVHFDPPNDHKDYLHRSGRTARAGATGLVVSLAQRDQVRELGRMHEAAGVEPARHEVAPGHPAVREIATTGTPVPPPPAVVIRPRPADAPARNRRNSSRPSYSQDRPAGQGRSGGQDWSAGQDWSGDSSGRQSSQGRAGGSQGRPAGQGRSGQGRSASGQGRAAAGQSRTAAGQSRPAAAHSRPGGQSRTAGSARRPADRRG